MRQATEAQLDTPGFFFPSPTLVLHVLYGRAFSFDKKNNNNNSKTQGMYFLLILRLFLPTCTLSWTKFSWIKLLCWTCILKHRVADRSLWQVTSTAFHTVSPTCKIFHKKQTNLFVMCFYNMSLGVLTSLIFCLLSYLQLSFYCRSHLDIVQFYHWTYWFSSWW